jgi:hypothetical protein
MITALLAIAFFAADDPVVDELNAAKKAHGETIEGLKEPTLKWCARQEAAVKRSGDKRALKEFERLRSIFEKEGDPPHGLPSNLAKKYAAAATALEKAYQVALREYRQAKNLPRAADVDKEWLMFRINGPGNPAIDVRDGSVCLVAVVGGEMALTVDPTDRPGAAFVVQRPADDADEQQQWIVHRRGTGAKAALAFQHRKYGLFMNVQGGSRGNGAEIILHSKDGRAGNEQWFPTRRGSWMVLAGAESRLFLGMPEGTKNSGARLIQWEAGEDGGQRFKLVPIRPSVK